MREIGLALSFLITRTTMAVDGVGNGPPFSKARWARLRVHGAGTVHRLFGHRGRALERVGAVTRSSCIVHRGDRRSWGILSGRVIHDAVSDRGAGALPRRLACSVRKLGTSNSSSTE